MDSEVDFDFSLDDESDAFSPVAKPKAKAAKAISAPKPTAKKATTVKAAGPKKMTQTTLNGKPAVTTKKRAKSTKDSENDDAADPDSTPPKKQKVAAAKKASNPLADIEDDVVMAGVNDDADADGATSTKNTKKKSASETFQKLTQLEHIIKRPDTYIGSVEKTDQQMWVFNKETNLMEHRTVSFVPGLYKIFDEILVNAADNKQRNPEMSSLKVTISREEGQITVENDGKAIPVVMHAKENVYIPELVFGHLLAGSNFDDEEKKTVGGRNGYGAKLCNVFSTEFSIEIQDKENGKRYKQTWTDNMTKMGAARITSNKSNDFVRVTFKPDFQRFGMPDGIDDDLESLLVRRIYDMAGTVKGIKVFLNGEQLKIKNFEAYCEMYAKAIAKDRDAESGSASSSKVYIDKDRSHPLWEVAFAVSDGSFQQVSFVNSIATTSGGTHVAYVADQICQSLLKTLTRRFKGHALKANHIKNHIFIFVNCFITNPAFTSQTKEQMTTKTSAFGSKCVLGDDFLKKIATSDAINNLISFAEKKADKMMSKSDGSKRSRINNAKLTEANLAGTKRGHECTLILTEGDSAKGLAVSGRAILDPDHIGVFPLRGKVLNVRDASLEAITKNAEIQNIKQILGLKHKHHYTDTKSLRYGHLMIMTDQDHDGSHIKGLLINFFQVQFPSLLQIEEFLREFITPIVKVWKGADPKNPQKLKWFFTQPEYEVWKRDHLHEKWENKYYKGLGTSSNEDAQRYFSNLDEHLKEFHTMKPEEADLFDLAFSKKKADARKEWLANFVPGTFLDHTSRSISYSDFVNKELILFSMADNMRSIPSMLDGFKPGQRKVMYGCFLKNLVRDMKVYELSGFVSQKSAYHHGDVSLQQTIVGLAQDFVGSNNINVLEPSGNFGSRLAGGSDAASPRYIFTRLSPFARRVFSPLDEPVLDWQWEEGKRIEPRNYAPIIPMVLANGADGIGTGWSTSIPNYHPKDIVQNLRRRMGRLDPDDPEERPFVPMTPWFRGWKGTSEPNGPDRYLFNGRIEQNPDVPNEVIITELPIRMWTDDFKARLEDILSGAKAPSWIKDYREFNDHQNVHFEISIDEKHIQAVLDEGLIERFKLTGRVATSNLVAFNTRGQIRKYANVGEIMEEFYIYRYDMYIKRKIHWLAVFHADFRKLQNQARFVKEIIDGVLIVGKKKKAVLVEELRKRKYEAFAKIDLNKGPGDDDDRDVRSEEEEDAEDEGKGGAGGYDYLLSMPIWSLTAERLDRLNELIKKKRAEHDELEALSEKDLWCRDLDAFMEEWEKQLEAQQNMKKTIRRMGRRASKKIGAGGAVKGRSRAVKAEDGDFSPVKKAPRAKAAPKPVETKTHERFVEKFAGKLKKEPDLAASDALADDDDDDDDDFAALLKPQQVKAEAAAAEAVLPARTKRMAASKAMKWIDSEDSESNDDSLIGDIGAMVKGISGEGAQAAAPAASKADRLGLHAMSRPDFANGDKEKPAHSSKTKSKPPPTGFDLDSPDDTNDEMMTEPSPNKPAAASKFDVVSISESDDDVLADPRRAAASKSAPAAKKRGDSKGSKAAAEPKKSKPAAKPAAKPPGQARVTKAAASSLNMLSDDDDELGAPSPPRVGRPVRGASRTGMKKKPVYALDDDDDDESMGDDHFDDDDDDDEDADDAFEDDD